MSDPTMILHPRWGWLCDEAPLFERVFDGKEDETYLDVVVGARPGDPGEAMALVFYELQFGVERSVDVQISGLDIGDWTPLTTAARELLAALSAEMGGVA